MENGIQKTDETEVLWQPENFYCPHPEVHSAVILLNNGISEDNVKSVLQWWCNGETMSFACSLLLMIKMFKNAS